MVYLVYVTKGQEHIRTQKTKREVYSCCCSGYSMLEKIILWIIIAFKTRIALSIRKKRQDMRYIWRV